MTEQIDLFDQNEAQEWPRRREKHHRHHQDPVEMVCEFLEEGGVGALDILPAARQEDYLGAVQCLIDDENLWTMDEEFQNLAFLLEQRGLVRFW
jgi:hypothetical protein